MSVRNHLFALLFVLLLTLAPGAAAAEPSASGPPCEPSLYALCIEREASLDDPWPFPVAATLYLAHVGLLAGALAVALRRTRQ
jgi:hypothetical protein